MLHEQGLANSFLEPRPRLGPGSCGPETRLTFFKPDGRCDRDSKLVVVELVLDVPEAVLSKLGSQVKVQGGAELKAHVLKLTLVAFAVMVLGLHLLSCALFSMVRLLSQQRLPHLLPF